VIFAHHIGVQQELYDSLFERYNSEIPVFKIFADMNSFQKNEVAEAFNAAPRALMVASALAAGEGLNLQTCADMIMHERMWNPGKEEQCEGRFPRPGQKASSINAIYTHMDGLTAIDAILNEIVERKRIQFHALHGTGEMPQWSEDNIIRELADSIVRGHGQKKRQQKAS